MDPEQCAQVEAYVLYTKRQARAIYASDPFLRLLYPFDEILSAAYYALSHTVAAWPAYLATHPIAASQSSPTKPYDSDFHFRNYLNKRIKGCIKDLQRRDDPYSRSERSQLKVDPKSLPPRRVYTLIPGYEPTPSSSATTYAPLATDPSEWYLLSDVALQAYLELPHGHRVALAFVATRPPETPMKLVTQRAAQAAIHHIIRHVLKTIPNTPPLPPIPASARPLTSKYSPGRDILDYLALSPPHSTHPATPADLITQFIAELMAEPSMLVSLASRFATSTKCSARRLAECQAARETAV